jgi:hypothetical protein
MNKIIEGLSWYGVIAILGAYALITFSVLDSTNIWYQILNGSGAIFIAIDAFHQKDYQPGVLNIIWAVIAIIAIFRIVL